MVSPRITISDIADDVGVSVSTVSRVLNGSGLVSRPQRDRILESAARLGYRKQQRRRQAGRTIVTIALVLPASTPGPLHLFYDTGELVDSVHAAFGKTRVNVVVVSVVRWRDTFEQKKMGDVDGCILAFTDPDRNLSEHLEENGIPTVSLNRIRPDGNYVSCDNRNGMSALVRQLVNVRGAEHDIVYLDYNAIPAVSAERRDGFLDAVDKLGIQRNRCHVYEIHHLSQINDRFFRDLSENAVRSVVCFNDVVAVYVYQAALHRGMRIPEDLSLTGFDNSPVRQLLDRAIDTVDLGVGALARTAADWLRSCVLLAECRPLQVVLEPRYVPGDTL